MASQNITASAHIKNGGFVDITLSEGDSWDEPTSDPGILAIPIKAVGDVQGGRLGVFMNRGTSISSPTYLGELTVPSTVKTTAQSNAAGNTHSQYGVKTMEIALSKLTAIHGGSGTAVTVRLVPRDNTEYRISGAMTLTYSAGA